jgi:hypothetical protein
VQGLKGGSKGFWPCRYAVHGIDNDLATGGCQVFGNALHCWWHSGHYDYFCASCGFGHRGQPNGRVSLLQGQSLVIR